MTILLDVAVPRIDFCVVESIFGFIESILCPFLFPVVDKGLELGSGLIIRVRVRIGGLG